MPYDGHTPYLNLPQWVLFDQLHVGDLNNAFTRLDEFASQVADQLTTVQNSPSQPLAARAAPRQTADENKWSPALTGETAAVYSEQKGWFAAAGPLIFLAGRVTGTFAPGTAAPLCLLNLPTPVRDSFPLTVAAGGCLGALGGIAACTLSNQVRFYTADGAPALCPAAGGGFSLSFSGVLPVQ